MQASPIHEVPNDVIQEIFFQSLPDNLWLIDPFKPHEAPVLVTHICKRWRNLVFGTPGLWRRLRWETRIGNLDRKQLKLEHFSMAAARAGSARRNLQVTMRGIPTSVESQSALFSTLPNIVNQLLVPAVPSLTRLLLKGVPIAQMHAIQTTPFPYLIRLVLYLEGNDLEAFPWASKGLLKTFSDAPALRRVAFGASRPHDYERRTSFADKVLLPWEQLTHILDFATPDSKSLIFDYLTKCHRLQYLFAELHDQDVGTKGIANWRPMAIGNAKTLDNLESISLHHWGCIKSSAIGYPAVLDAFEIPNLKSLRLDGWELNFQRPGPWTVSLADRFISRIGSLKHLTYLSLTPMSVHPVTIRRILLATPHIKTLDAFIHMNYESFFEVIVWDPDDRLLSKLETLFLELGNTMAYDEGGESIPPEPFDIFLKSRMQATSPFRQVVLYSSHSAQVDEDVPFVRVAMNYVSRGLCFERRLVVKERTQKINHLWVERDPELEDWPELTETHF